MTQQNLQQAYSRQNWQNWLTEIFGKQFSDNIEMQAEPIDLDRDNIKSAKRFAVVKLADGKNLAVLDIETRAGVQIARNRVGLRNLVEKFIDHARYHGIFAFYHSEDTAQTEYRLSYISSEPTIDPETGKYSLEKTAPKRFTYLLGENIPCRTPADRLNLIAIKKSKTTLDDVKDAFSVTSLNKEFFERLVGKMDKEGKIVKKGWYFKCFDDIQIDLTSASEILKKDIDNELKPQAVIRVIIRMMFIWFMKEKGLIESFFGHALNPLNPLSR